MNKIWVPKKYGKLILVIAYYFIIILLFLLFVNRTTNKYGGDFVDNLLETLLFGFIIIVVALIYPPKWILKKKLATKIEINFEKRILSIEIDRKMLKEFDIESLSYAVHKHRMYTMLVFYKKQLSPKSGNYYQAEIVQVFGNIFHISWSLKNVNLIEIELKKLAVSKIEAKINSLIDCIT